MCWESGKIRHTPGPAGISRFGRSGGIFFFISHPFSPEIKNDTKYRWIATRQEPYRYFMSLFLFTFHRKKTCPKSSAAPFRQNRPLSFRNHRSEAPADSGYILLKSDQIFQKLRSVQSGKDESNQRKQSSTHFLPRGSADAL